MLKSTNTIHDYTSKIREKKGKKIAGKKITGKKGKKSNKNKERPENIYDQKGPLIYALNLTEKSFQICMRRI